jgi:hypothetical protein
MLVGYIIDYVRFIFIHLKLKIYILKKIQMRGVTRAREPKTLPATTYSYKPIACFLQEKIVLGPCQFLLDPEGRLV